MTVLAVMLAVTPSLALLASVAGFIYAVLVRDDGEQAYAMFLMTICLLIAAGLAYAGAFTALTY